MREATAERVVRTTVIGVLLCGSATLLSCADSGTPLALERELTVEDLLRMSSEPYESPGWCSIQDDETPGWVEVQCFCPVGMVYDDSFYLDLATGAHTMVCWCENGSSEPGCDSSGGGSPPGGGGPGDPTGPGGGNPPEDFFELLLECDQDVARGDPGGCELSVSPSWAQVANIQWTATTLEANPSQSGGNTWEGVIVQDAEIRVDFYMAGQITHATSAVTVSDRGNSIWAPGHWETKFSYDDGGGTTSCFSTSRPVVGYGGELGYAGAAATPCQGQRIDPVGASGYDVCPAGGPNEGLHYVCDVSFFVATVSQLQPGLQPSAAASTLSSGSQRAMCNNAMGQPPGSIVSINFWNFNNTCAQVSGWSDFLDAAWAHEGQHYEKFRDELLDQPSYNLYQALEGVVRGSELEVHQFVTQR